MTKPAASSPVQMPLADDIGVAAAVSVVGADGEAKTRFKILPYGDPFFGRDGRGPYILRDREQAERVVAATARHQGATEAMVDYDHQSIFGAGPGNGGTAPASGWIKKLEAEDDGIWATVEWTDKAMAAMAAREYRYVSPYYRVAKASREVTRVVNVGLTNSPNLELGAVASESLTGENLNGVNMDMKAIAKALGLADDAGMEEVLAAIKDMKGGGAAMAEALEPIAQELGLEKGATGEEIVTAATGLATKAREAEEAVAAASTGAPDPKKFVPKEGYDELKGRLDRLDEERVAAMVDGAVTDGSLSPAMRDWGLSLARTDEKAFASFVEKNPKFESGAKLDKKPGEKITVLSDEEKAVASQLGLSDEAYLKARNEEEGAI